MADTHARRYSELNNVQVLAAVDLNAQRVNAFCKEHAIAYAYDDLDKALANHDFHAVSVVTPDAFHAPVTLTALQKGLPVLCEKPLSDTLDSAFDMCNAADSSGLLNMVNLSYRVSGALQKARLLVDKGELGQIRHVEASYRQSWLSSDYWGEWSQEDAWLWRLSKAHGSLGVLGDIGIHILDFLIAGVGIDLSGLQCRLQTFDKAPGNRVGEYTLDANDSCVLNIELTNGAIGVVHMSRYYTGYMNDLELSIHGTEGALRVRTGSGADQLESCLGEARQTLVWTVEDCTERPDTFERFIDALRAGDLASPDFTHAMKLQNYIEQSFLSHENGLWLDL